MLNGNGENGLQRIAEKAANSTYLTGLSRVIIVTTAALGVPMAMFIVNRTINHLDQLMDLAIANRTAIERIDADRLRSVERLDADRLRTSDRLDWRITAVEKQLADLLAARAEEQRQRRTQ